MALVAGVWPGLGAAQLAPTGGHYAGRASDTGTEPGAVNASGGYSASIPLDLPAARGDLSVPLSISSGARGVGAVGLGWEVPLSYVRRDLTFAHRKPQMGSDVPPAGREQVTLSLQGQAMDLLPRGTTWIVRYDAPDLVLKEQAGTWVMYDGRGKTWTFTEPAPLSGAGLWLLSSITGPDGTAVQLEYDVSSVAVPGGSAVSIDLRRVLYNKHPTSSCFKHEVTLNYGAPAAAPLSLSLLGDRVLTRLRILSSLDVASRASCTGSPEKLRSYAFTYLPDADTKQPRLSAVRLSGRQGTPEASVSLPVASFGYGSATLNGTLSYQKTGSIPLPAGPDLTKIASTSRDGTFTPPVAAGTGSATWQSLTDVTGDGLPDLVYQKTGTTKLWVALNRPGASGTTALGTVNAQLADTVLTTGAFETRSATQNRFVNSSAAVNIDQVWRQALDVNGDGRVDIVDAAETPWKWVVYLNTPGTGATGVQWQRRAYAITPLYNRLVAAGHLLSNGYLPLSSRYSGHDRIVGACWRWSGTAWASYPQGFTEGICGANFPNTELSASPEKTYTEWAVNDVNGDGFPDLVFNSSRVEVVGSVPAFPGTFTGEVINTQRTFTMQPLHGSSNRVDAVFNLYGLYIEDASPVFSAPITLKANTACGVGLWATSSFNQEVICGLADVNGDGLVDRVENRTTVALGTGRGFSTVTLTLPGSYATQSSAQFNTCFAPEPDAPGATTFFADQVSGLRDLTGDGIPDFVTRGGSTWTVAVGTGAGFAPAVNIDVVGSGFVLSSAQERCDGITSNTQSGLYDLNGDGKPEVVRRTGSTLDVYQLAGGSLPGKPEAGRIVQMDNGYGAKTTVGYRSAKEDGTTKHQVPFPEIVVTSVDTVGTQGLGGTLSATRYAYGGAELMYDSALHTFTLPGYQRSVSLRSVTVNGKTDGYGTITDTYPLPAFTAASKAERFGRYLQAGKVRDVTVLTSSSLDPWTLLATDLTTYARRLGGTHYDWATKVYEETPQSGSTNSGLDCFELAYPLDFLGSWNAVGNTYNPCTAHGFMYARATNAWRGSAAPPSANNVVTRSEVLDVDDYGRVLNVLYANDVYRSDDDLCVETKYATPTGTNERVLHAPMSRRSWTCDKTPYVTYTSESWLYDGLASGSVSLGHLTSHSRDRRDTGTGALLNTVNEYTASYNAAGNPSTVTRVREDGAVRTVKLAYDDFGLALVEQRLDATGTPVLTTSFTRDPVSLATLTVTDPNQTQYGTDLDGHQRPVRSTVRPFNGTLGVLSTTLYDGFSGTDPLGRRIVGKTFSDPVAPGTEGSAPGRTGTVYLDELGRSRRTEVELGTDYAKELLITGARTYDALGRVLFEADPYPASQNGATAYGTTYFFNLDGTPSCDVRGNGPQAYSATTDLATERIATCYFRSFLDHLETLSVNDAAALTAASPQAGVLKSATQTATGRILSRSTWKGTVRLEHATFTHDRLGQLTGMTRFLDPVLPSGPVQSSWTYDSFGQRLQWQEPASAVKTARYSNWGEPLEVSWYESVAVPAGNRNLLNRYDALGRVTHTEERSAGVAEPDTVYDFLYDVGSSPTSLVVPANVLGRLARTKSSLGEVSYSYDSFGREDAHVFTDSAGKYYVEKSGLHADGSLDSLTLQLPDNGYEKEVASYSYDTAGRLRLVKFEDPNDSRELYMARDIDPFGRVRKATHGGVVEFAAGYADVGRRLMTDGTLASSYGSRTLYMLGYDALGREQVRREIVDGAATGPKTNVGYDALGRLTSSLRTNGSTTLAQWQYTYDALGNVLTQNDLLGTADAAMGYGTVDNDQLCRVTYGGGGAGSGACQVTHDSAGNVVSLPSRNGGRSLGYFPSGNVRTVADPAGTASFRYGALGALEELDLRVAGKDARHEWKFGGLIELKDQKIAGKATSVITRHIPGASGIVASRRGYKQDWLFSFGELRGARYTADNLGRFIQDVDYQPFGEAKSSGSAGPDALLYSSAQWNGGEVLESFGLSRLGARLYDPVLGRFLSRDPLFVPRTAATTHPYAFAMNDPVNLSDPTGLDSTCMGKECQGPSGGANPQATYRPPAPTATFSQAPRGPQTLQGQVLRTSVIALTGIVMGDSFNYDTLAATGVSLQGTLDIIANTQEGAEAAVAGDNAFIDRFSSFFAGLGDSVTFWCPGCTQNMRHTWVGPNSSGDADSWSYAWGSITGIVGSFVAPRPTSIIAAPKRDVGQELKQFIRMADVNPSLCKTNCVNVSIAVDSTLAGQPEVALVSRTQQLGVLESYYGTAAVEVATERAVLKTMEAWGPGSRGIIVGLSKGSSDFAHAFNVVNRGGGVFFVDGQLPWASASLKPYSQFWLIRTN
ncbi:RHS repeat-associated core domain-containing protein [Corallococcus llansteffanensis]|uniref:RHS repeat-associated core domain-containing protein n=1 Tax=Corallococcus llansteffanensis TaxID=2316731 RepID=UPI0011C47F45|nr:RHS repeat-associated core domain-containing protein [Corallococcus llansteffanensis]